MSLSILRMKWLAPLIFFELYLAATILLFFFGPWDWNVDAPVLLASYLVAAQVFIGSGYLLGWRSIRRIHGTSAVQAQKVDAGIVYRTYALMPAMKSVRSGKSCDWPYSRDDEKADSPAHSPMHLADVHGIFDE